MKKNKKEAGIYVIEFLGYDKFYIGSSNYLKGRKSQHLSELRKNKHGNSHLQNVFNKYGEDSFKFSAIAICENDKEFLLLLEQKIIDSYDFDELINASKIVDRPDGGPAHNRKFSSEDIEQIFDLYIKGKSSRRIGKIYNADSSVISDIIWRYSYTEVPIPEEIVLLAQNQVKINTNQPLSENEIQFIKDNYFRMNREELSKELNRGRTVIHRIATKLGFIKTKLIIWTEEDDKFIIENYKLLSIKECAFRLGKNVDQLKARIVYLRRNLVKLKLNKEDLKRVFNKRSAVN